MLELKNIEYKVEEQQGEKVILHNINLSFSENKITVITGQNGSGKSTLTKLIMGIISPTKGKIVFDGQDITKLPIDTRANMGITLAFQAPIKFKGLSVKDLLDSASHKSNNLSESCEYLSKVGLCAKDYINRPLDDKLSGGELKRIELAMALCKGGKVFLFDEPEAGIDLWSFESLVNVFKSLKNATIIIISHQQKILNMADEICLLRPNGDPIIGKKEDIMPLIGNAKCGKLGGENND